ncbi:hypothetical protein Clacol_008794 [Clathrus columnatus]|uniref:Carboxylic ester hydrolase n=1 Tax=Clathrus columnatus TaxID=1419009 RepID=A0AAV5APB5_9AGAM|nr:hypothetical protein Clacol_008794 [Clathrus columnatus]
MLTSLVISLGLCLVSISFAIPTKPPTVDTGYAIFVGNHSRPNTAAFLGVPYAEPPLDDKRWRAPTPLDTETLKNNKKTFDASKYPDFCIQGTTGSGDAGGAGSEDCLKVNIYAPINATQESNLPVLVYIHGGGYIYGNPANWPFDHWVDQSPNVVIVSVYYRLNVFGFLAHPELEDPTIGSLNAGFLDQTEALRWVQSHISSFGGNPNKVTINGQSAGGSSVELHLVAANNERLFIGAIAQSVYRIPLPTVEQQQSLLGYLLQNTSCTLPTGVEQISCLRKASVSALIRSSDWAQSTFPGGYHKWVPVIDKTVLTDHPTDLLMSGNWAKVPIIAGATSNESLSDTGDIPTSLTDYFPGITSTDIQKFTSLYPENQFANVNQWVTDVTGDITVRCGRELLGSVASRDDLPSFAYRYNQPNPSFGDNVDVEHAAENWMMFLGSNTGFNGSGVLTGLNATETAFSQELIAYWLSFVRSSNPNTYRLERSPEWPSFSPTSTGKRQVLQQDPKNRTTVSGIVSELEPSADLERCDFTFTLTNVLEN